MLKLFAGLFVTAIALLGASPSYAQGATATFTLTIKSPASTAITLNPTAPCTGSGLSITCALPLPANTQLASIVVAPAGWTGGITIAGTTLVVVGGATPNYTINVGAAAISGAQTISGTLTATP